MFMFLDYLEIYKSQLCLNLLRTNPDSILKTKNRLKKHLLGSIHFTPSQTSDKYHLPSNWQNTDIPFISAKTSGTTTGNQFEYLLDRRHFEFVEFDCHYKEILREFKLLKPTVLYLIRQRIKKEAYNGFNYTSFTSKRCQIVSHGVSGNIVYKVDFPDTVSQEFVGHLVEFLKDNKIDVVLTDGTIINSLTYYIRKNNITNKLFKLLSNTNERLLLDDVKFLKENNNIDHFCDHMISHDGGAGFFTCAYENYHLLDNISDIYSQDNKLYSTHFFNFASPFVDYWNGDYAEVEQDYQLCKCGRWYREFKFLDTRSWTTNGITSDEIKLRIRSLCIYGIKYVKCDGSKIEIVSDREITILDQNRLTSSLKEFNVSFNVEVSLDH